LVYLLVLPLAASLLLGYQFSAQVVTQVPMVVVDHDNSALSRSLVRMIGTNQAFTVVYRSDQDAEVERRLFSGEAAAGLIVPRNFGADLREGKNPRLLAVYDGTQMSLSGAVKARLNEMLGAVRADFLIQYAEGKLGQTPAASRGTAVPLVVVTRLLGNPAKSTPLFVLEGALFCLVLVAQALLAIDLPEVSRSGRGLALRAALAVGPGTLALLLVPVVQSGLFGAPFEGTIPAALLLMALFAGSMTALGLALRLALGSRRTAIGVAGFLSAMMLFAGYTFPLFAMPPVFQFLAWLLPFTHFGLPLREVVLLGRSVAQVTPDLVWLAGSVGVLGAACVGLQRWGPGVRP